MKYMSYKTFASIIKDIRIEKRYKQKDMARILLTSKSRYCKIENGYLEPTFIELQIICIYLDIDLTKLLKLKSLA